MEIAARDDVAAAGENQRIVGRAVHLRLQDLAGVGEGVAGGAVDLRHAAQRVIILDASATAVGFPDRAASEQLAQIRRSLRRAGVGTRRDDPGIEGGVRAARGVEGGGPHDVRDAAELDRAMEGEAADRDGHLHPVDEGEPLLGAEDDRPKSRAPEGFPRIPLDAPDADGPFAHEREG